MQSFLHTFFFLALLVAPPPCYTTNNIKTHPAGKTISGDRVLNVNEFEFVIEALTVGAPMPASNTAKSAADGSVVFGTIEFTAEGVTFVNTYTTPTPKPEIPKTIYHLPNKPLAS